MKRGIHPYANLPREITQFEAWRGRLTGFHLRRQKTYNDPSKPTQVKRLLRRFELEGFWKI